jgi:hypothetical protein
MILTKCQVIVQLNRLSLTLQLGLDDAWRILLVRNDWVFLLL